MRASLLMIVALASGCGYDESLSIHDMNFSITLPEEAATRTFIHSDGSEELVSDPALIGPVYVGFYPSVQEGIQPYLYPEIGPIYEAGIDGDAYPYGGSSIGDIRFPCMEYLQCKVVSGRYVDFDDMVSWFNDTLEAPIVDASGDVVTSGDYIAQTCFDLLNYSDESEIRLTATDDKNEDGALDKLDLDFVQQADGTYKGDFTVYQQEYFQNAETGDGFTLWGWMDAPDVLTQRFTTCDPTQGYQETEYNNDFFSGRPYLDLLNFPSNYIGAGDWVASEPHKYAAFDDADVNITLGFEVQQ